MNSVNKKIEKHIESVIHNSTKEHTSAFLRIQVRCSLYDKIDDRYKWHVYYTALEELK